MAHSQAHVDEECELLPCASLPFPSCPSSASCLLVFLRLASPFLVAPALYLRMLFLSRLRSRRRRPIPFTFLFLLLEIRKLRKWHSFYLELKGIVEPLHNIENVIKPSDDEQQGLHFSPHKSLREDFPHKSNYTVLFEYAMLAGVNNRILIGQLMATVSNCFKLDCTSFGRLVFEIIFTRLHVLMQLQGCKEANFFSPMHPLQDQSHLIQPSQLVPVPSILAESGCTVFQRLMRGEDQLAACGQLGNPGPVPAPQQLQMALNSTSSVLL
ncbi:hypothetical protein SAY86_018538 [Trapa natans]|uniref:Uncharacterized protein n=1 Tax=Trapa natans TaxID=22666 RepID=A0AAN7LF70_TRANT|nr:hypothetical protein SAY86_018538 [Trapa natans]